MGSHQDVQKLYINRKLQSVVGLEGANLIIIKKIEDHILQQRKKESIMGRSPSSSDETGLKKGPWTPEEDKILVSYIQKHGHSSWRALPKLAGLNRCGKSCRLRWTNYLRPDIKRGKFTQEEEQTILNLHSVLGNKWSAIASHLPGRTDNEIKNFWNTHLKKKLIQMGFDPMTHRPRTDIFSSLSNLIALVNLKNHLVNQHQQPLDQYLQLLLQPDYNSNLATSSSSPTLFSTDLEHYYADIKNNISPQIFNNSISSTPYSDIGVSSSFENGNNRNPIVSFSHMPELLQIPYSANFDQEPSNKDDRVFDDNLNYHQFPSSSTPSPPSVAPPLIAETSINYAMDIAAWPEFLLEDPSFNEIA